MQCGFAQIGKSCKSCNIQYTRSFKDLSKGTFGVSLMTSSRISALHFIPNVFDIDDVVWPLSSLFNSINNSGFCLKYELFA